MQETCCGNNNTSTQSHSKARSTEKWVKESEERVNGGSNNTEREMARRHGTSKAARCRRKASSLDCAIVVSDLRQTCPKKGHEILHERQFGFEDKRRPYVQSHINSTRTVPRAAPTKERRLPPSLPPLKDTLVAVSPSFHSAVSPLTPNSALLTQEFTALPMTPAGFAFDDDTRQRKRHGTLPPLSLPQREPTLVVSPPTPTAKKPGSLPKLDPIRSQLSPSCEQHCQFLSQSAPANWGERYVLATPIHSSKSLEFSFPPCHTPSHFSCPSTRSESSLSSVNSLSSYSPSAFSSSPFIYDGDDEMFCHYPLPPPSSSKKSNTQRRRPGRRLVPFNKVGRLPLSLDPAPDNLEDIDEVWSCSPKSSRSESETDFEDSEVLKEYLRVRPGRRGAMCEKLEKNMNVVKINGKKYNLTTLRRELTEMMNSFKKYDVIFKALKFFR